MKNRTFTKTIEGVAEFLTDINKTYSVSSNLSKEVLRKNSKSSNVIYPSIVKSFDSIEKIYYRIHVTPDENSTTVTMVVSSRTYVAKMKYKDPKSANNSLLGFTFKFPQQKLTFAVDLNFYKSNPSSAESLIDQKIQSVVNEDFKAIFLEGKSNKEKEWYLETVGDFEHSFNPALIERYIFD